MVGIHGILFQYIITCLGSINWSNFFYYNSNINNDLDNML